jgi:glycosyltransferase involved in cell wall biosynthesis
MISCIIPTRNRGDAFHRALQSCLNQTIDVEIIVSDHNSTDGTEEYVRSLGDDRITYIRQDECINITWNWILGFMSSHGSHIKYVFDDDFLEPECCERLLELFTPDTTISQCGATFHWTGEPVYNNWRPDMPIAAAVRQGVLSVSPVTALIRRDALIYAWGLMRRLSQKAFDSGVGPNVLMNYATVAQHPERMGYTNQILCHLDDLPDERMSLTRRLRQTDPGTLAGCHDEAYALLDHLP